MPYIDFRSWRRPNWRYRRLIRDCTLRVSKEKRIPSEFRNTSNYDNLLNFLWADGAVRRFTILKRESLQPGRNNKCNFMYNSLYRFWICSVWCLRFTASKQHPYKALQPARPNRPTILIILFAGRTLGDFLAALLTWTRARSLCFHGCEMLENGMRPSCVKQ